MITLFHDFTEPASAIAVARIDRLIAAGIEAEVVGMDAIGIDMRLPVSSDVHATIERLGAEAAAEGLVLRPPPHLPPTALAHVLAEVAEAAGAGAAWRRAVYAALWEHGAPIDDPAVLRTTAAAIGLEPAAVDAALDDGARLAAVRRRTGERRRDGVGGVPTILAQRTLVPGLMADDDLRALAALG